jgi:hypothetical protein
MVQFLLLAQYCQQVVAVVGMGFQTRQMVKLEVLGVAVVVVILGRLERAEQGIRQAHLLRADTQLLRLHFKVKMAVLDLLHRRLVVVGAVLQQLVLTP